MVGPRGVAHTLAFGSTLILHVVDNYSDRLRVCDLGSRARRSAPQRPFRARRSSPGFDSSAFRFTVNRRTRRSPIARDGSWQMHVLVACGRGTWDGGSIPCVLELPGANAMVNALAFPFCSTLCSKGESVRARARDSPMTHEVHARASRDARVAARLEERRRVAASTISRPERKALCQFVNSNVLGSCQSCFLVAREKRPCENASVSTFRPRCTMRAQLFAHGGPWAHARRRGPPCGPGFAKGGRARACGAMLRPAATASHLLPCCDRQP